MAFGISFIVYICLLVLSFVPAVFLNSRIGYIPALMLMALFIFSLAYTLLLRLCIRYRCVCTEKTFFRQTTDTLRFEVKNIGFLIFPRVTVQLFCENADVGKSLAFSLDPHGSKTLDVSLCFEHIGWADAGIKSIKIFDLLGLFSFNIREKRMIRIPVYPKIWQLTRSPEERPGDISVSHAKRADKEMIYNGVREYVAGDPLKTIHWKLSAHTRTYMTRVFDGSNQPPLSIFLDFSPPGFAVNDIAPLFDAIVEAALSEAHAAIKLGLRPELHYFKDGKTNTLSPQSVIELKLAASKFTETNLTEVRQIEELMSVGRALSVEIVLVVTSNLTGGLFSKLLSLRDEGKKMELILITAEGYDSSFHKTMLDSLEQHGIPVVVITSAEQL